MLGNVSYYILIKGVRVYKKNVRHIVKQGDRETLCGTTIRKGERDRDVQNVNQSSCPPCRKSYLMGIPTIQEIQK
jgi:hypothetical protein